MMGTDPTGEFLEQETITVVIAGRFKLVRAGLRALISQEPRFEVLGEVEHPDGIEETIRSLQPSILVSEVCYGGDHILPQLKILCGSPDLKAKTLVVSAHEEPLFIRQTMQTGVHGYLPASATAGDLHAAVRAVAGGGRYLHPSLAWSVLDANSTESITPRERNVINLIARGFTTHEVAEAMFISPRSVEGARASVRQKIGVRTRAELFTFAHDHGYLQVRCAIRPSPGR